MRVETAFAVAMVIAAVLPCLHTPSVSESGFATRTEPDWPTSFQGRELIRLPLTAPEQRWAADFPGAIARFTDGERQLIVRRVERPTRKLHPSADCLRGLGYRLDESRIEQDETKARWSCFLAENANGRRTVCERIHDEQGRQWTDVSAWYWDAVFERSRGPWWAVTVADGAGSS
jgi:hypothetical protein